MSSTTPHPSLPHADYQRFDSLRQYETMMDELIPQTQRVIRIFDRSLSAAYNSPTRCELFRAFLRADPANRLFVVVHEPDKIDRFCPRFMALLQLYGHSAKVRQTPR